MTFDGWFFFHNPIIQWEKHHHLHFWFGMKKILFFAFSASLFLNIGCIPDDNLVNWYGFFYNRTFKKSKNRFFYQFKTRKIFLSKKNEAVESSSPFSTYQKILFKTLWIMIVLFFHFDEWNEFSFFHIYKKWCEKSRFPP